jgi:hypothetical protein
MVNGDNESTKESEAWVQFSSGLVDGLTETLIALLRETLEGMVYERAAPDKLQRHQQLATLVGGVLNSARAVVRCCAEKRPETGYDVDSGFILARALVERSITCAYLTVCGEAEFNHWVEHSHQKAFRRSDQRNQAGSIGFRLGVEPPLDPSHSEGLVDALARYTGKSGRENTRWTELSLSGMLGAVESTFADANRIVKLLLIAQTSVYDIGSEALHGTLLGVLHNMAPGGDSETHRRILLMATCECIHSVQLALSNYAGHEDWANAAKTAFDEMPPERTKSDGTHEAGGWQWEFTDAKPGSPPL